MAGEVAAATAEQADTPRGAARRRAADRHRACPGCTATGRPSRTCARASTRALSAEAAQRGAERAALPAAAAAPPARDQRLPGLLPAPGRDACTPSRGTRPGRRAGRAGRAARGLERVSADDRAGADARRLLSGLPGDRRPRAARARRRVRRRRRRLGVPPRALPRSGAAADLPPARAGADRRARRGASQWRDEWAGRASSCCAALGLDAELDIANDPFFGRRGRMLAANQREQRLKFELLVPIAGPEPTALRLLQPPPRAFRQHVRARRSPTAATAHTACLGFGHERIVLALLRTHGLDPDGLAERRARASCGGDEHRSGPAHAQPDRARDPASYHGRIALHAPGRTYLRDQLLHGHPDRAAARAAATSRWPASATSCGWTSRATSGRSSSRRRRTSSGCSGSTSTRCSPTGRCPMQIAEQIERGRTIIVELDALVPARHGGHQLPRRARQDLGRRRRRSTSSASGCATSTTPGCTSCEGEDYRGVFRTRRGRPRELLPPYTELVRFDAGSAPDGEALRTAAARRLRGHSAAGRDEPVRALRRSSSSRRLPALLAGDLERLPRVRVRHRADGRRGVRAAGRPRRMAARRRRRRRGRGRGHRDRRRLQGAVLPPGPPPAVRSQRPRLAALAEAWDAAIDALLAARDWIGVIAHAASRSPPCGSSVDARARHRSAAAGRSPERQPSRDGAAAEVPARPPGSCRVAGAPARRRCRRADVEPRLVVPHAVPG